MGEHRRGHGASRPGWRSSCATCPCRSSPGCARTGCCAAPRRPGSQEQTAGRLATAANSPSVIPPPGANPTRPPARKPRLYGTAWARAWNRLHPRLTHRSAWIDAAKVLPVIEGTVIRLEVDHLPSGATPKPVWLWWSGVDPTTADIDRLWQTFLRRFDIEHTFRLFKQTLGWTAPKVRTPQAADRWTWLILAAYTQLRLARPLAADLRRPWERPAPPERLTPARVRRGFRHLRANSACPAGAPKPNRPGPGRPPGRPNRHPTRRYDVHIVTSSATGKTTSSKKKSTNPRPHRTG
ncbi:hypothetical protein Strop_3809 [Salinispora tropica CNB-440]|uniref:Transposase IS701-like DDE domain-containing protein n=1 Tax=Salinispora tropica (strain ATCC BAA-916 / DSM 44818 / JCM 13857 / NBRC 105044 / CNB-440) TaxID=369723 RepID=A4XBE1_SALTO|nr:hypothetical protein Strop_3809 [Salinispora tropica CNB-440]